MSERDNIKQATTKWLRPMTFVLNMDDSIHAVVESRKLHAITVRISDDLFCIETFIDSWTKDDLFFKLDASFECWKTEIDVKECEKTMFTIH